MIELSEIVRRQHDVIFRMNLEKGYTFMSESVKELLGYSPQDYYDDPVFYRKITVAEDLPRVEKMIENLAKNIEPPKHFTFRQHKADGEVIYIEFTFTVERDKDGKIVALEGVARDVSARKIIEKELAEKLQQVKLLGDDIANGFRAISKANGWPKE